MSEKSENARNIFHNLTKGSPNKQNTSLLVDDSISK